MIYKVAEASTNRIVTLVVRNVSLNGIFHSNDALLRRLGSKHLMVSCVGMAEFEQGFIQRLAVKRASTMFFRGEANMLAYTKPDTQENRVLHVIA